MLINQRDMKTWLDSSKRLSKRAQETSPAMSKTSWALDSRTSFLLRDPPRRPRNKKAYDFFLFNICIYFAWRRNSYKRLSIIKNCESCRSCWAFSATASGSILHGNLYFILYNYIIIFHQGVQFKFYLIE